MNRDLRAWIPALIAGGALLLVAAQTLTAFQRTGHWSLKPRPKFTVNAADPYTRLERLLSQPDPGVPVEGMRDPFSPVRAAAIPRPNHVATTTPAPVASARPLLTAIISDPQDPRAVIVYDNHNYSVKAGDLFAEFRVVSISTEEVVLDNGRDRIVLQRPGKGR